jgi:hypothetical protein
MGITRAHRLKILATIIVGSILAACGGGNGDGAGNTGNSAGNGGSGGTTPLTTSPTSSSPGVPNGDPTTQTIDSNGGSLTSLDGRLSVTVPPGALSTATDISIQPVSNTIPGGDLTLSNYRLQPEGTAFATPITLTFHLEDYEVEAIAGAFVATQDANGSWNERPGVMRDASAKTISVTTTHFSDWAILQTIRFSWSSDTLHTGAHRNFEVWATVCTPQPCQDIHIDLTAAGAVCSAAAGSMTTTSPACAFTAPGTIPSPNPVIITARIALGAHVGIAVGRVKITNQEEWFGWWDIKDSGTGYQYRAGMKFDQIDSDPSVLDRHFAVSVPYSRLRAQPPASIAPCTITPLSGAMASDDGSLEVDYTGSQDNPKVSTTGGKTFWPVTVSCEGQSYPASLGGVWLAPDQTFANNGKVTFTINLGSLSGTAELQRNY